jgi:hypothetical protein
MTASVLRMGLGRSMPTIAAAVVVVVCSTELVWTAFLPLEWEKFRSSRLLAKTGLKVDFKF